jgi:hypothetical protein
MYVGNGRSLYVVDVDTLVASSVTLPTGFSIGMDFVVVDGVLWTYSGGSISSFRLVDGRLDQWSTSPDVSRTTLRKRSMVGAMWFDSASGSIFGEITKDGTLVQFTGIGTGTVTTSLVGRSNNGATPIDGATCR